MAYGDMTVAAILLSITVMASVEEFLVSAQAPSPTTTATSPPITCTLPSSSMVSSNSCNSYDEQSMETQTAGCDGFLTNQEPSPSAACCKGLNEVAYHRTACICAYTFYPPSSRNASRQLDLPSLCNVLTNLCGQCPSFLVNRSNGTSAAPITNAPTYSPTYSDGKSMASTIGAISLAVVFGLLLVGGIVGFTVKLVKIRRAKNNPPGPFEAAPPGGAY